MKKKLLAFLITFGVMIAGTASASLWSFYNGNLPSIAERTPIAQEAGISNYTGTYSQNIALEAYLRGGMEVLGATPTPTSSAAIKYVEAPDFYAYSPAVAGDTTITINNLTDIYGNKLTMADFGNIGYGRIDPDGAEVSESFTFTGVTANSDGTYTLTGVKSVLAKYPYTQTSGLVRSHSINAIVRFTNTAAFYDNFANKENDEIIDGSWSFLNNTFSIGDGANTNKTFKFNNGATNTPEMVYDATNNQLKFRRSGETSYTEIPLSLRGTYANYASLPTDASNGDIAITTDDYKLYTYNATGATWVLAGGSSGAGTVYKTVKYGTEADGDDNKTFTLTAGSWPDEKFLLVYKNGMLMENHADGDYEIVDSNTIEFNYEVEDTDKIVMIVVSVDLYNPAWGLVNASIVPDTDNAYDIGSSSKQFKDIYLEGDLIKDGVAATSTPTANAIPVADGSGKLDDGWLKSIIIKSFTAGENITAGDAVSLAADTTYTMAGYYGDFDAFVTVNNTHMKAQTFVSMGTKIKSVKLEMSESAAGAVNATVSIRSTTGGLPSGSDIEGKTSVMSINGQNDYIFVFSEPVNVISGQVYAIVVKASSSIDIGIKNSNVYSGGSYIYSSDGGSTWTSDSNKDFKFVVTGETEEGYIYKSNSTIDNFLSNNFIGFAYENITSTNSGLVTLSGLSNNHTGLTTGTTYYLSNTAGAISTSPGSVSRKVGLSISATEILIKHDN